MELSCGPRDGAPHRTQNIVVEFKVRSAARPNAAQGSRARPPVDQKREEVDDADVGVGVELSPGLQGQIDRLRHDLEPIG